MAATGGGKIRTRRYHIVSKPYAKGKQQPGLISRVTDRVKSIVPSWLQRYFKNGDVSEGEEVRVEVEQNNVAAPPNGNQEANRLPVARNSPEPSTSNAEPSTSKASLNFQDALSRPPLNRSHLHFPSHDGSPALGGSSLFFSPPSTSTAPFPGSAFAVASSNFSLVKEIKDSSSQHEDDNISTTSGFSSRASDKDVPTSKPALHLWSPETDRTLSGSQPSHISLKKPAFNLSVFSTSSSSTMNNSVLNSSQLGDSPFYPGKTTYGGAAAAKITRTRPGTPYQAPVRRQIKAKPAGAQPCGVTSATARRILQSLERMSSPLADAKRIPSLSSPSSAPLSHPDPDVFTRQSKRSKVEPAVPPVQKLVIPVAAAVSGNRSMSFRPSLTPGFVSKAVEKSTNETHAKRPPQIPDAMPSAQASTSSQLYPISSTPASSMAGAGGGKMKRERTLRSSSKRSDQEVSDVSDLPTVFLPISKASLPTFSFSSPPPTSTLSPSTNPKPCVSEKPAIRKETPTVTTPYTFASPIFKTTAASPSFSPTVSLQSEFTFSEPTIKTASSVSNGKLVPDLVEAVVSEKEEFEGPFKPAKVLKQGSVLDILKGPGFASSTQSSSSPEPTKTNPSTTQVAPLVPQSGFGDKFKPAVGLWNCDSCSVKNKPSDKKCVACQAVQPSTDTSSKVHSKPAKAPAASLATLFTPPAGSWDCDTCLVRNKPEVVKCVACDTAKPGTGVKPALAPITKVSSTLSIPSASSATTSTISGLLSFGDKFKKPEGAWDCVVCMVQNKAQEKNCVACQSAKPGAAAVAPSSQALASTPANAAPVLGFGDKFKKPEGSWECEVCSVQNKAVDQQCVACQSAKPGTKAESKGFGTSGTQSSGISSSFKFGTSSLNSISSGLKFGGTFSDTSSTTGSITFGNASTDTTSSANFKFGGSNSGILEGFKFGGAADPVSTDKGPSFKFSGSSDGFKFGAASTPGAVNEEQKSESSPARGELKFVEGDVINFGSGATSNATTNASGGFSYGLSKQDEKTESSSAFSFSIPKAKAVKQDTPSSIETVSATATPAANAIPVFVKPPIAEPHTALPSFGESTTKEVTPAPTPSFMFGKPEEKDTSTPPTGFLFSAAKDTDKPAPSLGFSFSQPDPPKELPKTTFSFGKPAESTEIVKPSFSFGQNATDTAAPKPAFGFMGNSSSGPASSSPAPSLFGTSSSSSLAPTPAPTNTFIFGQNASSDAPPSKTFMFGQQQDSQPAPAEPPAGPAPQAPFVFGSGSNSTSSGFSFGNAASTQASAAPAPSAAPTPFGFTSNTSTPGFGSAQTPAFGSSQPSAPAFGTAAPSFTPSNPAAPAFGAKPDAASVFGQQTNPTPAFGSATTSAGQGFQFGGASGFGASNSSSAIFTFGAASGTTGGPTASPAMSTQPAVPGGGFSFTPNFNIGSAKNSFNSTPTGPISGRKIKTAVRRRK